MKRVFVLSQRSLFHKGIESLLSKGTEFEIVGQEAEPEKAVECILSQNPDVIILNLDDPEPSLSSPVLCVLREKLATRIVGLSLKENKIHIFQGKNKQIHNIDDLFQAIID